MIFFLRANPNCLSLQKEEDKWLQGLLKVKENLGPNQESNKRIARSKEDAVKNEAASSVKGVKKV